MPPPIAKIVMEVRLGVLDVKENYHGKYKDTICRNCNQQNETTKHFISCISQNDPNLIENMEQIWKLENMENLEKTARQILQLIENNQHFEYKMI